MGPQKNLVEKNLLEAYKGVRVIRIELSLLPQSVRRMSVTKPLLSTLVQSHTTAYISVSGTVHDAGEIQNSMAVNPLTGTQQPHAQRTEGRLHDEHATVDV